MALYAVIGFDHPPHSMALREKFRAQHREFSKSLERTTRLAGALYDKEGNQCGTMKIFEAESPEQVLELYRKGDPFYNNGVYKDFRVIEWKLAFNSLEPSDWVANYPGQLRKE